MVEIKKTAAGQSILNRRIGVVNTQTGKEDAYKAQANAFFQLSQSGMRLASQLGQAEAKEYAMGAPLEARDENGNLLPAELPDDIWFGRAGRADAKQILDQRYMAKWRVDAAEQFNNYAKNNPTNADGFKQFSASYLAQTQGLLKEQGDEALANIVGAQGYTLAGEYALKLETNAAQLEQEQGLADAKANYDMITSDMAQRFANGEISFEQAGSLIDDMARDAQVIFGATPRYAQDLKSTTRRALFERKMAVSFRGKSETEINTAILDLVTNNTDSKIAQEEPDLFVSFQQIPESSRDGAESEMNSVRQMVANERAVNKEAIEFQSYVGNGFYGTGDQSAKAFAQLTGTDTNSISSFLQDFDRESLGDPGVQKFMRQASSMPTFIKNAISQLSTGMIDGFPGGVNGALVAVELAQNFTINPDGTRHYKNLSTDEAFFLNGFTNLIERYGVGRAAELHQDARKIVKNDAEWLGIIHAQTEYEGTSVYEGAKQSLIKHNPGINIADLEDFVYPYAKQLAIPGMDAETAAETVAQIHEQRHLQYFGSYLLPGRETVAYSPAYYFRDNSATRPGFIQDIVSPDKFRHGRLGKFNNYVQDTVRSVIKQLPGGTFGTMPKNPAYGTDFFVKPSPNNTSDKGSFMVVNHEGTTILDINGAPINITTKGVEKMFKMKTNQALIAENLEYDIEVQKAKVEREELQRSLPQFVFGPR